MIAPNLIDHTLYDHASILATLETLFVLTPMTDRDKYAKDFTHLFSLKSARTDAPLTLPEPYAPVVAEGLAVDSDLREASTPSQPVDAPLEGNDAGFLHVLLRQDLSTSAPEEQAERVERFKQVRTKADAKLYVEEVNTRLAAHDGVRNAR